MIPEQQRKQYLESLKFQVLKFGEERVRGFESTANPEFLSRRAWEALDKIQYLFNCAMDGIPIEVSDPPTM
jgi:cell division GTPase FtsZ